jgi:plastocyanin
MHLPSHALRLAVLASGVGLAAAGLTLAATPAAVRIDNFHFNPVPIKVKAGDTVTWTNQDDIPHSIVIQALGVHSRPLDTDADFAYRFEKAGVYDYICGLHPFMKGRVEVTR